MGTENSLKSKMRNKFTLKVMIYEFNFRKIV